MKIATEQLNHLKIVADVIKELDIINFIDTRLGIESSEVITQGETVSLMILNGLGFCDQPLSLMHKFLETETLDQLFGKKINHKNFNRFKLGRVLDKCYTYNCSNLFAEISAMICKKQNVDLRFNSLDTTPTSLTEAYNQSSDENAIKITQGYSKEHKPDLKQATLEMMVSHDGDIPKVFIAHNRDEFDTKIFQERAKRLVETFKNGDMPRYLIADSKLYTEENLESNLKVLPFITSIPESIKLENQTISETLQNQSNWHKLDNKSAYKSATVAYWGHKQRWIIITSDESSPRNEKRVEKLLIKELKKLQKSSSKCSKKRFLCKADVEQALKDIQKQARLHQVSIKSIEEHKGFHKRGKPTEKTPFQIRYQVIFEIMQNKALIAENIKQGSCLVLGTNIPDNKLSDREVIQAYKNKNSSVERDFRFFKDPIFFTSTLFVKKPERIEALLMVMTLALLIYSICNSRPGNTLSFTANGGNITSSN
jgi:transposase